MHHGAEKSVTIFTKSNQSWVSVSQSCLQHEIAEGANKSQSLTVWTVRGPNCCLKLLLELQWTSCSCPHYLNLNLCASVCLLSFTHESLQSQWWVWFRSELWTPGSGSRLSVGWLAGQTDRNNQQRVSNSGFLFVLSLWCFCNTSLNHCVKLCCLFWVYSSND